MWSGPEPGCNLLRLKGRCSTWNIAPRPAKMSPMRSAPLLLWSMRSPWRSAWWWSLIAVAALGPAVLARALNLSILDAGASSTPQEWNLLAVLAGSLLGLTQLDRASWILDTRTGVRAPLELALPILPALMALGVAVALGAPWWGVPSPSDALGAIAQALRLGLLGTLLWTLGLRGAPLLASVPLMGWVLPALLSGWTAPGPHLAAVLSSGTWPAEPGRGAALTPSVPGLLGLTLALITLRILRSSSEVRDPR